MDPVLFRMNWDTVFGVIGSIIVLAVFVERALAIIVESRPFVQSKLDANGIKEVLSLATSYWVVFVAQFDALATIFQLDTQSTAGYLITAGIVAGGSKGSLKLFRDVLEIKSSAIKEKEEKKEQAKNAVDTKTKADEQQQ